MRTLALVFISGLCLVQSAKAQEKACTVFPVGNRESIVIHEDHISSAEFSPDGKRVVTGSIDGTSKIYDLDKQEMVATISHQNRVLSAQFSPNGKQVVTASADGTSKIYDLNKKEVIATISHQNQVVSAQFSPDGKKIVTASEDKTAKIYDLEKKEVIATVSHQDWVYFAQFSPEGKQVVTVSADGTSKIYDLNKKEVIATISHQKGVNSAQFSPDGKQVVTASADGTSKIYDLNKKVVIATISHRDWVYSAQFSPDGKQVVTASEERTSKIYDLNKRRVVATIPHEQRINSAQFSPDGKKIVTASEDKTVKIYDLEKKGVIATIEYQRGADSTQFSPDGKRILSRLDRKLELTSFDSVCAPLLTQVKPSAGGSCMKPDDASPLGSQTHPLTQLKNDLDCTISGKDWRSLIQLPLSPEQARMALTKFQDPKEFDPKKDIPLMNTLLASSEVRSQSPELVSGALQSVLTHSNLLYEKFIQMHGVSSLEGKSASMDTESIRDKKKQAVKRYLRELSSTVGRKAKLSDWQEPLTPLQSVLKELPADEKSFWMEKITDTIADSAVDTPEFSDVFSSKIYKLVYNRISPWFGEEKKRISDVSVIRSSKELVPMILASHALRADSSRARDYSLENEFGFHSARLAPVSVPDQKKELSYSYQFDPYGQKKEYQAKIDIHPILTTHDLAPHTDAPDYASMLKDGKMYGLMMVGSNIGSSWASETIDEYLEFYQQRGYEFSPQKQPIQDVKSYLEKKISSGELDYLRKDAHSDGDEKNLFSINTQAQLLKGIKKDNQGKVIEEVDILYPAYSSQTTYLPNRDFGSWIQERKAQGKGPLVFFNGSCWSYKKAIYEIEAAQSPLLVEIPTTNVMYMFVNSPKRAEAQMLRSLLDQKDYDHWREAMKQDEDYKKGSGNGYILPDEKEYTRRVRDVLKTPLEIKIDIRDAQGRAPEW